MLIEEMFKKDIHRPINGVVQAGQVDLSTIKNELEEYVMTEEGTDYLKQFYKNYLVVYQRPSTNIGVWISGFFGSGKSHLLKILSYLLDNKEIGGKKPYEYLLEKTNDEELKEKMRTVAVKDSDAILFNIDSKSSAAEKERIVEVFLRVFNGHLGYSDTLWVAEIERLLDSEGKYDEFKREVQLVSGETWEEVRRKLRLKRKHAIQALINMGYDETTAEQLFTTGKDSFEMTSERLANMIADYCRKRGPEYRLVFLVDEVGQYVGNGKDTGLMLNLQTVVEDLGNYCTGQVWVVVTSQEKIDAVTAMQSTTDFSKIQGRFATRINLSSSNTDEVIKRRLLEKKEDAAESLVSRYQLEEQMIRNRLSFDPNSTQLRSGYRSIQEFVALFPFVPYQVELLQKVFNKIRTHGEGGAHLAHGERSLLKAFQEAAQLNATEDMLNMVTMAEFFPSIRGFLESSITSTISRAEDKARNAEGLEKFDVEVLKVLYLIKGIDEIKSTANNVAVLLLPTLHSERAPLEYRVKESLARLQQEMFIEQRADQTYAFLSDDEQEINKEIRNELVSGTLIKEQLASLFFDRMYTKSKFEYDKQRQPFEFNKRFDSYSRSNMSHALTLQVFSTGISTEEAALAANSGDLILCLDENLIAEAESALQYVEQVRTYVLRKKNPSSTENQIKIYDAKLAQINDYEKNAEQLMQKACERARFFINSQERNFSGNFETQVNSALHMLVTGTYNKLDYITKPIPLKEIRQEWKRLVEEGLQASLEGLQNGRALDEVKRYLEDMHRTNQKISLKQVIERFNNVPYGWGENDIVGLTLALIHDGKVKLTYVNEPFPPSHVNFYDRLSKSQERDRMLVIPVVEVDPRIKRDMVAICRGLFGRTDIGESYEAMATTIRESLEDRFVQPLRTIRESYRGSATYPYPGGTEISRLLSQVQNILIKQDAEERVRLFLDAEGDIDAWLEETSRFRGFYGNKPMEHFDQAVQTVEMYEQDIKVLGDEELSDIRNSIVKILTDSKPYREIPNLPILCGKLKEKVTTLVDQQRKFVLLHAEAVETQYRELIDYYQGNDPILALVKSGFERMSHSKDVIQQEPSITTMRAILQQMQEAAKDVKDSAHRLEEEQRRRKPDVNKPDQPEVREKAVKKISATELFNMFFSKRTTIETASELDEAINQLKAKLIAELRDSKLEKMEAVEVE